MNASEILSNLKIDLSIKSRQIAKETILMHNITAASLIDFITETDSRKQTLLICVLDYIVESDACFMNQDIDAFISLVQKLPNETCKRCNSRISYHILKKNLNLFSDEQKNKLIEIHFDWLISNSLVATRVNCLSVLFELRNQASWIKSDLTAIIDQQISLQEPSFVSRAKKILAKIHKEAKL